MVRGTSPRDPESPIQGAHRSTQVRGIGLGRAGGHLLRQLQFPPRNAAPRAFQTRTSSTHGIRKRRSRDYVGLRGGSIGRSSWSSSRMEIVFMRTLRRICFHRGIDSHLTPRRAGWAHPTRSRANPYRRMRLFIQTESKWPRGLCKTHGEWPATARFWQTSRLGSQELESAVRTRFRSDSGGLTPVSDSRALRRLLRGWRGADATRNARA